VKILAVVVFVALGIGGALLNPHPLLAATYTTTCPATDDACLALAERLEAATAATEANGSKLDDANDKLDALHTDLTTSSGPSEIAGTVALSSDDADRLDIAAWGVWFLAGLTCCLLFSQLWHRAWKFWA
jgi:hypothetical protein